MLCTRGTGDSEGVQNPEPGFKGAYNILLSNSLNYELPKKRLGGGLPWWHIG